MIEEQQYTIRNLEELNEIDEGAFSKLERISFELPNGELVNEQAEYQALRILEFRQSWIVRPFKLEFEDLFGPWEYIVVIPLAFTLWYMESNRRRQVKKESYRQFCELRDKINEAYRMPINYRSYPVLEERIMRD